MRKSVLALTLALLATVSFAQISEDFEGTDITGLETDGWVFNPWGDPVQFVGIETTIVHGGTQALSLPRSCRATFPIPDEFGTLNIWVYDSGITYDNDNAYGPQWGIAKGNNWIGGGILDKSYLPDEVVYAAATGAAGNTLGGNLYSFTWMDAGLGGDDKSRGVAGWMNWEIIYHSDGKIQIDLLSDPNGCTSRRHCGAFEGDPDGKGDPEADGTFADLGGADSIYILGSRSASPLDPAEAAWGNLIVDDITWTPESGDNPGDVNRDGTVNIYDFLILRSNYGKSSGATWEEGDMNGDGAINIYDFLILRGAYGVTY